MGKQSKAQGRKEGRKEGKINIRKEDKKQRMMVSLPYL
jgi:hypothetical protein